MTQDLASPSAATRTEDSLERELEALRNLLPSRDVSGSPEQNRGSSRYLPTVSIRESKPCNECGRPTPFVFTWTHKRYGWRICWKCMRTRERRALRELREYRRTLISNGEEIPGVGPP